jgi:seryl-tRNA synthetase
MLHTIPRIDYQKIADAVSYYASCGYTEISVPWIVNYSAYLATKPSDRQEFYTIGGYLNASGEQSFIDLMEHGVHLKKHMCITPCFRYEETLDDTHYRYFMKVELIDTNVSTDNLHTMITDATTFFLKYTQVHVIQTDTKGEAFDIIDTKHGIELGSYGIRHYKNFSWIYGTGLALPRLDVVLTKQ